MESTAKKEAERMLSKLKVAIRLLGFTNREIERRLEYTPSYLTRLFGGQIELRFEHIVDIARAMGLTADEFFAFAYPPRNDPPSEAASQLTALLEELKPSPSPPARPTLLADLADERLQMRAMLEQHHASLMDRIEQHQARLQKKRTP